MEQQKILIIITKGEIGGAQMSVLNLASQLKKRGQDVTVGMGEGGFLEKELTKENIPTLNFKWLKRTHNLLINWLFVKEMINFLNSNYFDVIHINSSNALFAAKSAKKSKNNPKTVFTFRGMSMLDPNYKDSYLKKTLYKYLFKFLIQYVDKPVFVSQHNLNLARKQNLIKNGHLVYNGLNPENLNFLDSGQARRELMTKIGFLPKEGFFICSIGRLHYQKNYEFLINIFPKILKIKSNAYAVIIGDGPKRAEYEKLIKDKGLENRIILAGSIQGACRYLKAFDIFVLASRYEGLSVTLMETLFAGVPVLATDVGGAREMFSKNRLYELNNVKEFLQKFKKLVADDYAGEVNKQNANKFSIEKTVQGYIELYRS